MKPVSRDELRRRALRSGAELVEDDGRVFNSGQHRISVPRRVAQAPAPAPVAIVEVAPPPPPAPTPAPRPLMPAMPPPAPVLAVAQPAPQDWIYDPEFRRDGAITSVVAIAGDVRKRFDVEYHEDGSLKRVACTCLGD